MTRYSPPFVLTLSPKFELTPASQTMHGRQVGNAKIALTPSGICQVGLEGCLVIDMFACFSLS